MRALPAPPAQPILADESEEGLVACVLLDPEAYSIGAAHVAPKDFRTAQLAVIWQAMAAVHEAGALPDFRLVIEELDRTGAIVAAGGRDRLLALVDAAVQPTNAEHYARKIRDAAGSRRLAVVADDLAARAKAGESPASLAQSWDQAMRDLHVDGEDSLVSLGTLVEEAFREIGAPVTDAYTPTGFPALDEMMLGWEGGQLVLLGARPSMGKTAFALNCAAQAADAGHPVAFLSLEMTRRDLMRRLLAWSSGLPFSRLRVRGWIPAEEEWDALAHAADQLKRLPLWIDDTAALTLTSLRMKLRRLVDRGVRAVFVDYLGLVVPPRAKTIGTRENEIGTISRALKRYAKEFDVAIIALQQLSRARARENEGAMLPDKIRKPDLTDLRDSGSLEQDADAVLFLHRNAYYTKNPHDHTAEILIRKQRNGECGTVTLAWSGEYQRFSPLVPDGSTA